MNAGHGLITASAWILIAPQAIALGQASFQRLGELPGGVTSSAPWAISDDGLIVVGESFDSGGRVAFLWTAENGMIGLGSLSGGDSDSIAYGISGDGLVIVGRADSEESAPNWEPFRWTAEEGMVGLGDLPGGVFIGEAHGASAIGGVIVGHSASSQGSEAFRWTQSEGMIGLGDLPGGSTVSRAHATSADGSVIVGYSWVDNNDKEAFRWTADEGMVGLGDLSGGSFHSIANDVSADGSVIVGRSISMNGSEAFRWTATDGMVGLGDLPGGPTLSEANAISADGKIIVGGGCTEPDYPYPCGSTEPFIWDADHGMRNLREVLVDVYGLDLSDWILYQARDTSADGLTIVGVGFVQGPPFAHFEAWLVRLPDCNGNGQADDLDILDGDSLDVNDNVIPDECECLADLGGDGEVGPADLAQLLGNWGPCGGCPADLDGDGAIGPFDLALLLGSWGACP